MEALQRFLVPGLLTALLALPSVAGASEGQKFRAAKSGGIADSYIVLLADQNARDTLTGARSTDLLARRLSALYGGEVVRAWSSAVRGFEVRLDEAGARALAADDRVKLVEQNQQLVTVDDFPNCYGHTLPSAVGGAFEKATQTIVCSDPDPRNPNRDCVDNWGLDRIDQASSILDGAYVDPNNASSVDVYVLDTGINADHDDFVIPGAPVSQVRDGQNVIAGAVATDTDDCVGHGTHVAGIIGGNRSGVAKRATLHPVKFYDTCASPGGGTAADVMAGFDWIVAHHDVATDGPAVVNYSGGNGDVDDAPHSLDSGVQMAALGVLADGIAIVQAAGNQKDDLNGTPTDACARTLAVAPGLEDVIVAGGTDYNVNATVPDGRWIREPPPDEDPSWDDLCAHPNVRDCGSNSGACVDIWAPAAHIISAVDQNNTDYCRLSGTSMAAPHVTGAVAVYLQDNPTATPAQVQQALVDGATCGVLDDDPASPYYIGVDSPNLLVNVNFDGGGPAACAPPEPDTPNFWPVLQYILRD
jgi:subtilisin family serine protease